MLFQRPLAVLFAGFACVLPWTARAGDYHYPTDGPLLTVTLPDGWQVGLERPSEAGLTTITTAQDPNYAVLLLSMVPHLSAAGRDATLAQVARAAATAVGLTEIEVSPVTEEHFNAGLRAFATVHASGKLNGTSYTLVYSAFSLAEGGRYFIVGETGPNASLLAHKEDFQKIANSIEPYQAAIAPTPGMELAPPATPAPPGVLATPTPSLP